MKHDLSSKLTLLLCVAAFTFASPKSSFGDWVAGRDLKANELPDGNGVETINPNPTVPEWSYGYRGTLTGTSLTLFTAANHTNSDSNPSVQGFDAGGTPLTTVNVGSTNVIFNFGFGNLNPLHPGEMKIHPGPTASTNQFSIVRWIAPASGSYLIDAYWTDLDPNGTQFSGVNGASGAITLNGSVLFNVSFGNNSGTSTTFTQTLNAGDIVDFLTGSQGDYRFDDTAFNATITLVPEPTTTFSLLVGVGLLGALLYWRRRFA
jgi:hypothetical protein